MDENSAARLHSKIESWRLVPDRQSVWTVRGTSNGGGNIDFWTEQVAAAELLAEVRRDIEALRSIGRPVEAYERAFPTWAAALWAPDLQWNQSQNNQTVIEQHNLDLLFTLGEVVRGQTPRPPVDPVRATDSRAAMQELLDLLSSGELSVPEPVARYVFELINSVRTALDESSAVGSVDLLRRVNELVGFLQILADELQTEDHSSPIAAKLRDFAHRVVPYAVIAVNAGVMMIGAAADLKALGQ